MSIERGTGFAATQRNWGLRTLGRRPSRPASGASRRILPPAPQIRPGATPSREGPSRLPSPSPQARCGCFREFQPDPAAFPQGVGRPPPKPSRHRNNSCRPPLTAPRPPRKRTAVAQVAELVDAPASGAGACKGVEVRVLSWAPLFFLSRRKSYGFIRACRLSAFTQRFHTWPSWHHVPSLPSRDPII